jgi:hypothetical protein
MLDVMQPWMLIAMLATLTAAVAIAARRRAAVSDPDSATQNELVWPGTFSEAFQRSLDILGVLETHLSVADPDRGVIRARRGAEPFRPPAFIEVSLRTTEGVTLVSIHSKSRTLMREFMDIWARLVEPTGPA